MNKQIFEKCEKERFCLNKLSPDEKIHFIGLGGIGMSALARVLIQSGYKISGSDLNKNHLMQYFETQGAEVYTGHKAENLHNCCAVIKSSAIKEDNPEYRKALENNIPVVHRSELLDALMRGLGKISMGVTGTHGKTSTTGMLTTIFYKSGLEPGFAIGGEIPQLKTNSGYGKGNYFISELDESDGTIAIYSPDISIITNLELEHTDHYQDGFDQLLDTMENFLMNTRNNSKIIINTDDSGNNRLIAKTKDVNFITYSINSKEADYYAEVLRTAPKAQMKVYKKGEELGEITLGIPGRHNISNALGATAAALEENVEFNKISAALAEFTGMKKRFQNVGTAKGAVIIDDYAHHPTEITATIKTCREIVDLNKKDNGRIIAVFQPHRYTRFENFWNEFLNSFDEADIVYVCDVYSAEECPISGINSEEFVKQLKKSNSYYIKGSLDNIADAVIKEVQPNDMVLTMGAGNITYLGPLIVDKVNGKDNNVN